MMDLSFTMIISAAINRFRGGGLGARHLPGHPRFYAAPFLALLAALYQPWPVAVAIGAAYLVFVWPAWDRWMTMNRMPRSLSCPPSWWEAWIERIADFGGQRRDWLAFSIRNVVLLIPAFALVLHAADAPLAYAPLAIAPALGVVALYEAAWRIDAAEGMRLAEWLVGGAGGVVIAVSQELF